MSTSSKKPRHLSARRKYRIVTKYVTLAQTAEEKVSVGNKLFSNDSNVLAHVYTTTKKAKDTIYYNVPFPTIFEQYFKYS